MEHPLGKHTYKYFTFVYVKGSIISWLNWIGNKGMEPNSSSPIMTRDSIIYNSFNLQLFLCEHNQLQCLK